MAVSEAFDIHKISWVQVLRAMQSRIHIYVDRDQLS